MAQMLLMNPRKRRAGKKKTASRKRRTYSVAKNPTTPVRRRRRRTSATSLVRSARRRVRRNPIGMNGIVGQLTSAAVGAGGAIGVDFLFNMLPLPLTMKSGYAGIASKAALAVGVGVIGKKMLGGKGGALAEKAAAGALTVIAYDAMKSMLPPAIPAVDGLGYVNPGYYGGQIPNGLSEYVGTPDLSFATNGSGMGEYVYR